MKLSLCVTNARATLLRRLRRATVTAVAAGTAAVMVSASSTAPAGTSPGASSAQAATTSDTSVASISAAAPRGDLSGWRQVFVDDFSRSTLGGSWSAYRNKPGNDHHTQWDPSQVRVADGVLTLTGQRRGGTLHAGAVSLRAVKQTYGKYVVRMRVDPSDEMKYAALLWPTKGWPPEIDFAEDGHGSRSKTTATLHYGPRNTMKHDMVEVDLTRWHDLGVEWSPGKVVYTLDGEPWATRWNAGVSSQPMRMAIQQQASGCLKDVRKCDGDDSTGHRLQVDWVAVYARR